MSRAEHLPAWLKILYTAFVVVLIPIWCYDNGPANFLWFSDIALLALVPALWFESRLIASTMAVAVLLLEIAWMVSLVCRLFVGADPIGLAAYMTDPETPRRVKWLSATFHVAMPATLVWMLAVLGYDRRALAFQIALGWIVLLVTFLFTDPGDNINWVFGPGAQPQHTLPPVAYLVLVMVFLPVGVYWPTHWMLSRLFAQQP